MAKIGIFWIHKNMIIGKARELSEGEETVPGILDSPDSHFELWEHDSDFLTPFPELRDTEYEKTPRGRVMFRKKDRRAIVYMDDTLHNPQDKKRISDFFQLCEAKPLWRRDEHYMCRK